MSDSTQSTVGCSATGLGIMGGGMVANLQRAGFRTVVNDIKSAAAERHLAAGGEWAETPSDLARRSDVIFTCLPGIPQIETVALGPNGLIEGIRPGNAFFEMSTNSIEVAKKLGAERSPSAEPACLTRQSAAVPKGAERGRMAIWVGGDKSAFDQFKPVLKAIGDRPTHVGPVGAGLITKLVHNCASQSMQAALAEVFSMGVKAEADPLPLWEAIRQGSIGRRRTFDGLAEEFSSPAF